MSVRNPTATEQNDKQARATVNTTADGEVLGIAIFLGKDDLSALGVADADTLGYQVEGGHLKLREVIDE